MKDKDRILLEILSRYGADQITVTGVRDQLLSHYSDDTINPADARRWVNGKFSTLLNKGVLIRKKLPDSKKYYFKKTSYYEQYISSEPQPVSLTKTCAIPIDIKAEKRSHPLHTELESYRQTMLSQLGEIEEYRRIRETYPDLGDAAAVQFQEVADDNYRMLGRIRALEKLIANAP